MRAPQPQHAVFELPQLGRARQWGPLQVEAFVRVVALRTITRSVVKGVGCESRGHLKRARVRLDCQEERLSERERARRKLFVNLGYGELAPRGHGREQHQPLRAA